LSNRSTSQVPRQWLLRILATVPLCSLYSSAPCFP